MTVSTRSDRPSRSRGGTVECHYYETPAGDYDALDYLPPDSLEDGAFYWVACADRVTGEFISSRYVQHRVGTPAVSGLGLARWASSTLTLSFPDPSINPPGHQLPGIETWLWIDGADWEPVSTSAAVPGLSATVTATPTQVVWELGDGSAPLVCAGPGTPYDPDRPVEDQSTDCGHVYQRRGVMAASATVTWELTWSATDGTSGSLTPVSRTTTFTVSVAERQAVGR